MYFKEVFQKFHNTEFDDMHKIRGEQSGGRECLGNYSVYIIYTSMYNIRKRLILN